MTEELPLRKALPPLIITMLLLTAYLEFYAPPEIRDQLKEPPSYMSPQEKADYLGISIHRVWGEYVLIMDLVLLLLTFVAYNGGK